MDLTARQIYHEVEQATLDMFIYLSLAAANGTCRSVTSLDKSLPICNVISVGKSGCPIDPKNPTYGPRLKARISFSDPSLPSILHASFEIPLMNMVAQHAQDIFTARKGIVWFYLNRFRENHPVVQGKMLSSSCGKFHI